MGCLQESGFNKPQNFADGSYYIESLTDQLAEKALAIFKEIEKADGFLKQLKSGIIQKKVSEYSFKDYRIELTPVIQRALAIIERLTLPNLEIKFNPTTAGTKNANISIANNDADEQSFIINFSNKSEGFGL